jgi:lipopolysaccharide export system protein LptA
MINMKLTKLKYFLLLATGLVFQNLSAQDIVQDTVPANDSGRFVQIIKADVFRRIKQDSIGDLNVLVGKVVMKQNKTLIYCDSAIQNVKINQVEAFGNIHINDADSVHTYSQYLKYQGDTKIAELKKKVKMTDGKGVLTTEALEYDINANIGTYKTGGKVVNGESVLTSKEGFYYADTKEVYFQKNVRMVDPEYTMSTDTLLYNLNSEVASFVAATTINDGRSTIKTRSGYYDLKQGKASFSKRPVISDSTQTVVADNLEYDKNTSAGIARGNVFYKDSAQGMSMLAGAADFNNEKKTILCFKRPLMLFKQNDDSLYVAADTLYSAYVHYDSTGKPIPGDTLRYFRAHFNVKMFSDSLQGKCDSLCYSGVDSVFRFYKDPVMWAQGSQISGDTLYLFTKWRKADKVLVNENAFSVNKTSEGLYNQLRGNNMNGQFINGEIDFLRTKGNSESLYYLQDEDSAYIGMTYSMADAITMKFINRELKRVTWINGVTGTTYPINQVPADRKELKGFQWLEAIRPKSIADLVIN